MSYPPQPPMIAPAGYTFTPLGMMPMGVIPPTAVTPMQSMMIPATTAVKIMTPPTIAVTTIPTLSVPKEKPPVTTVFVGNISERAPDTMIRLMLQRCGTVLSWKRVQGASGKLQAFGFCEYEKPESTLRCIRLLNDWTIADKRLVAKVDAKTKTLLDEYLAKKKLEVERQVEAKNEGLENGGDDEGQDKDAEGLDVITRQEDKNVMDGLNRIMVESAVALAKEPPPADEKQSKFVRDKRRNEEHDNSMDLVEMEQDRKVAISQEIRSFRDLHKDDEPASQRAERSEREMLQAEERRQRDFQRVRDRELYKARMRLKSRSRSRSPAPVKSSSERRRSRSRERSTRSRDRSMSRDRERRDRERALEIEEEAHERRKLEKKLREKEAAYRERLKTWESRESKKHREYRKERDRDGQKKDEEEKEARRLKEFLEDYDDERDDVKYYKGGSLQRRMKEREKEIELDDRDRAREKEELEEIKRRLHDEGHPDVEAEIFKLERQRNEHLRPKPIKQERIEPPRPSRRHKPKSPSPVELKPEPPQNTDSMDSNNRLIEPDPLPEEPKHKPLPSDMFAVDSPVLDSVPVKVEEPEPEVVPSSSALFKPDVIKQEATSSPGETANTKRKKLTVVDVFNQDEDEDNGPKKRKLVPLDYNDEDSKKPKTIEEKRAHIKTLIERIPTAKEELFEFPLDWSIVDTSLMDKRIKPWVNKKIVEYIGEEEPTLTEFICQKVIAKSSPQNILNDVAMVLDEEAEVFIVKMWRLLIYETEAKKAGLVK